MFTGLIECLGTVRSINRSGTSIKICIAPGAEDYIVRKADRFPLMAFV